MNTSKHLFSADLQGRKLSLIESLIMLQDESIISKMESFIQGVKPVNTLQKRKPLSSLRGKMTTQKEKEIDKQIDGLRKEWERISD